MSQHGHRLLPPPHRRSVLRRLLGRKLYTRLYRAGNPDWHRQVVGGMWTEMGQLQFDFLVQQGLKPTHRFLDVGCGSLRGGIHFIRYLEPEHYWGIDINLALLRAGREEVRREGLAPKAPRLVRLADFEFQTLGPKFDYALAQSVFTHLPLNRIIRCLVNIDQVLIPGGRFYATFFESTRQFNLEPLLHSRPDGPDFETYFDRDPYHYNLGTFQWVCAWTGLSVTNIGQWGHPRDQRVLLFTKTG